MTNWSKYPFVRMLIPMALGIWCANCFPSFRLSFFTLFVFMIALFLVAIATSALLKSYRLNWLFGVFMGCFLFVGGYALTCSHEAWVMKDYFRNFEKDADYYVVRVYDYPTEHENNIRVPLQIEYQFADSLSSRAVSGKVMAYFHKSDSAFSLRYGDLIAIDAPIGEIAGPKNPSEFDYRAYLYRKGITGQIFLEEDDWIDLQINSSNPIYAFSYRFRDILLASLHRCGLKDDEFGVTAAILLGYDDNLADKVRKNYVAAGSMHILCVSGMHVGIIYLLAGALLSFLNRKRWQKILKNILLLVLIWFYALIAGLTPSILRASLMISFVIIGETIRRTGFIINSIAASAFILLCLNPNNLFEIGFQLSYAAVLGIVVLQHPMYCIFYIKNKFLDKVWAITTVALAAQIATIPFTLFYFNQFTTYFFLSNLFMTPISFIVVISGMILLLVSWIPFLNTMIGYLVWSAVYLMNAFVSLIESMPSSIIKGLYISELEFVLLLFAFLLLLLAFAAQKRKLLIGMLSVFMLFMVSLTVRLYTSDEQSDMIFYSLRKHTVIDFVWGGQHVLLADTTLMDDESTVDYSLKGAWAKRNLSLHPQVVGLEHDFENSYLFKKSNLISFNGKLCALWDESYGEKDSLSYRLSVDYLLVLGRQKPNVQSIVNSYNPQLLLIDGSVPQYLAEQWISQANEFHLPYYDIREGAFEADFDGN